MNAASLTSLTASAAVRAGFAQSPANVTSMRWAALSDAGALVATLAGIEAEPPGPEIRNFPALVRDAEAWRRERAEHGIADLGAIMEPGIVALLAISARGADPRPAAVALWREFIDARRAILSLLPPVGSFGPNRST